MVDVFISYARASRAKAESISARLEERGLDCFLDLEDIDGGANFPDVIDRALRGSKAVLCCWSPHYFKRPWCMIECRDALARGIMAPVAIERFDELDPPADLRQINWFDLVDWEGDDAHEHWRRTLLFLSRLVGRDLAAPNTSISLTAEIAKDAAAIPAGSSGTHAGVLSDLRATWTSFPAKQDPRAVERFLERVRISAAGTGLEFEVEHCLDELRREVERRAEEAERADAARRAREAAAEEARRQELAARLRPGNVWRDAIPSLPKAVNPEMITLPPGRFMMGSPNGEEGNDAHDAHETPSHEVRIDYTFAIGNYPVTFAEWDAAIAVGAKLERPVDQGWGRDRRPVINVSWDDAKSYIAWLNMRLGLENRADAYRLPSEAEWEYACRAGTTTSYSFGASINSSHAQFLAGNAGGETSSRKHHEKTAPVGSFPANAFGLHDMHGNVWEWCEDVWNAGYDKANRPDDGSPWRTGDGSRRVVRGGSWNDDSLSLRSASRRSFNPAVASSNIGFRLARTLLPPQTG